MSGMAGLDAHIMGLNDPRAPFNEKDPMFDVREAEEVGSWFVVRFDTEDVVAGPFDTRTEAEYACADREPCHNPGRHGCGRCDACEAWAEREIEAREDRLADDHFDRYRY